MISESQAASVAIPTASASSHAELPAIPVKILFEGDTVDADELAFVVGAGEFAGRSDSMTLIRLSDGATLEFKHKVERVYRLRDRLKDGLPVYALHVRHEVTER